MQCQRPQGTSSPISRPRETRTQNPKTTENPKTNEIKLFHTQTAQTPQTEKTTHFDFWGWFFETPKIEITKTIEEKQKEVLKEVTSFSLDNFAPLLKLDMDTQQRDELKELGRSLMALHDKLKNHKSSDESTLRKDEIEFKVLKIKIHQKESEILKKQEERKQIPANANKAPKMEAANLYPSVPNVKPRSIEVKPAPLPPKPSPKKEIAKIPEEKPKTFTTQSFKANMKTHFKNCGKALSRTALVDPFYGLSAIVIGIPCSLIYLSGALIYEGISYYKRRKNS